MISKHSHEQSERGEGVEVVQNEPFEDPTYGAGQFTEKRVYLNKWVIQMLLSTQSPALEKRLEAWIYALHFSTEGVGVIKFTNSFYNQ